MTRWRVAVLVLSTGVVTHASTAVGAPRPRLELPKHTYFLGESVLFWIGLASDEAMTPASYQPCRSTIIDPDGRRTSMPLTWPIDGDGRHGWMGGWGVADANLILGTYTVQVSCGSLRVQDSFSVEEFAPLREVEAAFEIHDSCDQQSGDHLLTLAVANSSERRVLVAVPGALDPMSFMASTREPRSECSAFFPPEVTGARGPQVGEVMFDVFSRRDVASIPHVSLDPGDRREWSFCLERWIAASCPIAQREDDYRPDSVRVHALLQMLFEGDPADALRPPIRRAVSAEFELRE